MHLVTHPIVILFVNIIDRVDLVEGTPMALGRSLPRFVEGDVSRPSDLDE